MFDIIKYVDTYTHSLVIKKLEIVILRSIIDISTISTTGSSI